MGSAIRRRALLVVLALAVSAAHPAYAAQGSEPRFPSGTELVTVDVLVLDEGGRPVEGLTREDFTVTEDGRQQSIASFEAVRVPESASSAAATRSRVSVSAAPSSVERVFVVVFDDANLTQYSTHHAREAVSAFIRDSLRPGDQVMVVPTAGGPWWGGRIPEDRQSLLDYVARLEGRHRPDQGVDRIHDHEAMAIWTARDPKAIAYVARRWFDNNLIPESYPTDRDARAALDVSPGLAMIRAKAQQTYASAVDRLRLTLATLTRLATSMAGVRGRKNLMLVSEGFIMDPSQPEFRELVQAARTSNAAVHFLDARAPAGVLGAAGLPGGSAEAGRAAPEQDATTVMALAAGAAEGARSVALDTGGAIVPATAGLGREMGRIAEESRAYYLLGYVPANTKRDGSFRRIQVSLRREGRFEVRARRGYYAPGGKEPKKPDGDQLDRSVRAGLDAPFAATGLPLRLASHTAGPGRSDAVPVLLVAEVDIDALGLTPAQGRVEATLETYVVVQARGGGEPHRQERLVELAVPESHWQEVRRAPVRVRREFELAPGVYQARLLVRHRESGRIGTVRHEFEVPVPGGLRTSSPVLTDVFAPGAAGQPPLPVPVARRVFAPGSRLGFAYDVYGAMGDPTTGRARLMTGYEIRRRDGTAVARVGPAPLAASAPGVVSQTFVFAAPSEAGDYEFVLQVADEPGGASAEVVEPFSVSSPLSPAAGGGRP